ncbi:MAG: hypothetical protein MI741_09605 [Rhodospirillales bacterium]|nr:hypothetical protein [Rhodospirillales bacterium]
MLPEYPIYVISKGRWESRLTARALEAMDVPYRVVIEPQEYQQYSRVIDPERILVLPFSNLGQGSIPARNWVWEHSISEGHERHWILDDNLAWFGRIHKNKKTRVNSGVCFKATEDFVNRYLNVALAGLQYEMFVLANKRARPFVLNTRIYSCILIRNDLSYRWRGRYNEDTDLSLRVLKGGWCTILMQAFVCKKIATMKMKGGNTDELYRQDANFDGRLEMARHLQRQHPDVTTIKWKWGRWQHQVDYTPFRTNRLYRRKGLDLPAEPNNYGMQLIRKDDHVATHSPE